MMTPIDKQESIPDLVARIVEERAQTVAATTADVVAAPTQGARLRWRPPTRLFPDAPVRATGVDASDPPA